MKPINFVTDKGEFLLVDLPEYEEIEKELQIFGHDQGLTNDDLNSYFRHFLPDFNKSYELSEITEEQASQIINNFDKIPNDVPNNIDYCKLRLDSFLKSKGLHLYENPFPKPENYDLWSKYGDFTQYGKTLTIDCLRWKEAEEKTYINPFIFKL